ncbi:putative heat shock protein binding protein [Tripterygium wilfordii]|uniref:Putative heat shock protein binding protein n=1 Tax=Tripterygium wilfordii TaxID=458696 RepID=A0A7J7DLF7_TRIWF|nr:J domain-containing protein required for chloroplast accumulation response 1-like [Tripterygium wilfordii]KAF5747099.1 putative heat shock protein binding protein [Tripterygium wilfordii]
MERFSHREGLLSGSSSQRFFASPNTSSHRDSDVDFADVFGGPPRRSSNSSHERRSFSESTESRASSSRNPWTGLMEKPVFGEEVSNTRRHTSHNFFDDIYKGSDCSSSPRKYERDSIFSMTGSRALSPSQPLPPAEPLSSSLLAQFSLPAKLVKGTELPTYSLGTLNHQRNKDGASSGINNYSYSPLSRSSSQTDRVEEDLSNRVQSVFHQSSLSKNLSPNSLEVSNLTTLDVTEEVSSSKMDSGSSNTLTNGGQFHFFIYKWASKGVPIAMPLRGRSRSRLKETGKVVRFSGLRQTPSEAMERESLTATPNDFDFLCLTNKMSTNTMSSMIQLDKENVTLFDGISPRRVEGTQIFEEEVRAKTESETISTPQIIGEDIPGNSNACAAAEERKSQSLFELDLHLEPEQDTSVFKKKAPKTELNTLGSLLCDDNDGQGNGKMAAKNAVKESKPKTTKKVSAFIHSNKNVEKQNRGKTMPDTAEVGKDSLLDTATTLEGNPGTNRMKRKVKEFVKIFNQDPSSKSKPDINSQGHISRWKDRDTFTKEDDLIPTTKTAEENMDVPNVNQWKTPEAFTKMKESYLQTEKQDYHVQPNNYLPDDTCTGQINKPVSTATSNFGGREDFGVESVEADELFTGNFQIKELPQDEDKLAQTDNYHDEIQVINAKIRQWSSGKDGNIRSLLSTLQYILWPESGWRPVPLVDIIEGKGVRRSYQKALLCLHPDKLQQKGASPQQKYIAEKVFDILQDAWTHFNSLGSL